MEEIKNISFKIKIVTDKNTYEDEVNNIEDFNKKVEAILNKVNEDYKYQ